MPVPVPGSSLCRAVQASMATSFDYNQTDTSNLNLWRGLGYWIQPLFLSRSQSVNSPVSVIRQDLQETRNSALKCGKNSLILAWSLGLIHTLWRSISILQKEPTQWCSIIKHFLNLAIWPTVQLEQHRFVFKLFYIQPEYFFMGCWWIKYRFLFFFLQGAILYAHYGQTGDFKSLQNLNISSEGKIVLIRAGKISFAEKVGTVLYLNSIFF